MGDQGVKTLLGGGVAGILNQLRPENYLLALSGVKMHTITDTEKSAVYCI